MSMISACVDTKINLKKIKKRECLQESDMQKEGIIIFIFPLLFIKKKSYV